jgi:hypothetical protein
MNTPVWVAGTAPPKMHTGSVRQWLMQWRISDPRLVWVAAVDVIGTLLLIIFLLTGHHDPVLRVWAVLAWVMVVPGTAVVKWRYRQHP